MEGTWGFRQVLPTEQGTCGLSQGLHWGELSPSLHGLSSTWHLGRPGSQSLGRFGDTLLPLLSD
jgi:hypothetical protein